MTLLHRFQPLQVPGRVTLLGTEGEKQQLPTIFLPSVLSPHPPSSNKCLVPSPGRLHSARRGGLPRLLPTPLCALAINLGTLVTRCCCFPMSPPTPGALAAHGEHQLLLVDTWMEWTAQSQAGLWAKAPCTAASPGVCGGGGGCQIQQGWSLCSKCSLGSPSPTRKLRKNYNQGLLFGRELPAETMNPHRLSPLCFLSPNLHAGPADLATCLLLRQVTD